MKLVQARAPSTFAYEPPVLDSAAMVCWPVRAARVVRTLLLVLVLLSPACVVPLGERNVPLDKGGVSGPPVDCSVAAPPPGEGSIGAAPATNFVGRFDFGDPTRPRFDWSGNSMSTRFRGTEITWGIESNVEIVFEQVVDGRTEQVVLGGAAPQTKTVQVSDGEHTITVVRSSEASFSEIAFVPFSFAGGAVQLPPFERQRRIEFIGDSITCGYGNEGLNASCPFSVPIRSEVDAAGVEHVVSIPETENIYLAYGSIAARKLSADAVTLCYSGKGIVRNNVDTGEAATMVDYYARQIATNPDSAWDFAKEQPAPQVVVIGLGTNDFAHVGADGVPTGIDLAAFQREYSKFVDFVRSKRRDAHIFLALSPMVTETFPLERARTDFRTVLQAIADEKSRGGDTKVYVIELVEMGTRYGLGCDYHPNLEVHRIMADQVASAVASKTCWSMVDAK